MSGLGQMTPLRLLCLKHGTTRRQLASDAGVTLRTLYNIEGGKPYALETADKIAKALGEELEYVRAVLDGSIELALEIREVAA